MCWKQNLRLVADCFLFAFVVVWGMSFSIHYIVCMSIMKSALPLPYSHLLLSLSLLLSLPSVLSLFSHHRETHRSCGLAGDGAGDIARVPCRCCCICCVGYGPGVSAQEKATAVCRSSQQGRRSEWYVWQIGRQTCTLLVWFRSDLHMRHAAVCDWNVGKTRCKE